MPTAIINLTRFGDLLQTQPLVSSLYAQGANLELISLESFQAAAALLGSLQRSHSFPDKQLTMLMKSHWPQALSLLHGWLASINSTSFDRVINITPSLSARLLARCIDSQAIVGFGVDEHGFGMHTTAWAAFLQAASAYRHCNPFNLVDLFQRLAGQKPHPFSLPKPLARAQNLAHALLQDYQQYSLVGFQLGASQESRRWPVEYFVQAGRALWQKAQVCPILLGTKAEAHLAQEFGQLADYPYLDLSGKTDLSVLAAVLQHTKLLLTNDTGTMHLAAGLGTPILAIFLATAQPFDTGPYLEGALSLEPDLPCHPCSFAQQCQNPACIRHIQPDLVANLAICLLSGKISTLSRDHGVRLWQACRDEYGFMDQVSLSGHEYEDRTIWIKVQRSIYRQFLDQDQVSTFVPMVRTSSDFSTGLRQEVGQYLLLITLIEEQGRLLSMHHYPSLKQKFLLNCQNLHDILSRSTYFGVLGLMWQYLSNEHSQDMNSFVRHCGRFRDLFMKFQNFLTLA